MKKKTYIFWVIVLFLAWVVIYQPFYTVPIIKYHSIETPNYGDDTPKVDPRVFEKQMHFIKRMGYRVISMDEYIKSLKMHKRLRSVVVITIDDGYVDNYFAALPVLKKYGFPATIFIITEKIGVARFLNYEQIKEMEKNGITFGSHTLSHHYLPVILSEEELKREIFGSKKALEKLLGHRIDYFCYPLGGFSKHIKDLVKEAGYATAFTTNRGKDKLNRDIYALRRIKITNNDKHWWSLWFKMSGYFHLFQPLKEGY